MNTEGFERVVNDVRAERARQIEKFGDDNQDVLVWMAVIGEEVGEANQAALHDLRGGSHAGTLRAELVQVAASAMAAIADMDRKDFEFLSRVNIAPALTAIDADEVTFGRWFKNASMTNNPNPWGPWTTENRVTGVKAAIGVIDGTIAPSLPWTEHPLATCADDAMRGEF